ncbi:STAS domain-containing protein [Nonomuraea sp. KC401]|uniref:STAS domain-containing protein n=1 Tax=unclassified Nonomuraea TaxID=2593643 RepID=UPI0010FDD8ED|nr:MULTISPECIES: STAS domain-containing protein [unclassified Nonomuraea]NBE93999.1 anti-sigma factor antagonist [Nonomuraea sp. K271]TLF58946.1 STAS domain-containing protein [Nonomuraea sp. KC401]
MTERGLRIEATRYVHCTVIRASGELDHDGRVRLSTCITSVWDWSAGPVLVFDLHDLDFYDSSVIGVLAMAMQRMEEERSGGEIILVQPDHHLLSVLRLTDLLSHVELADSVEQVVAELMVRAGDESSGRAPPRVVLRGSGRDRRG